MNSIESDDAFGTILVRVVNAPLFGLIFVDVFFRGFISLGLPAYNLTKTEQPSPPRFSISPGW
jgi:hypothetical protein